MSDRHIHQATAATNYAVGGSLERQGGDAPCWVPTLIFYAAMHVLDARLADYNLHMKSQGDRHAQCAVYSTDSTGPASYRKLKILSEAWRYKGDIPTSNEISQAWRWAEAMANAIGEPWPPR